jgi:hypothetical protein
MPGEKRRYISYLLRLWQIKSEGELVWQGSLEHPRTRERRGFTSLESLFDFIRAQTDISANENGANNESRPQPGLAK